MVFYAQSTTAVISGRSCLKVIYKLHRDEIQVTEPHIKIDFTLYVTCHFMLAKNGGINEVERTSTETANAKDCGMNEIE